MDNEIQNLWKNFIDQHKKTHLENYIQLNSSATVTDFVKFKKETNFDFPFSLKPIYELNNGQGSGIGLFFGLEFLSIDEIIKQWKIWHDIHQEELSGKYKNLNQFCTSYPPKAIKVDYTNDKWIPFSHDNGGNHIGIDLDPDVAGKIGQIINFGRDEDNKIVIAENTQEFLKICLKIYESDDLYKQIEKLHFIDYLKKEFREKK